MDKSLYCGFPGKKWVRQGKHGVGLGLASWNNFGRLWAIGVVPSSLGKTITSWNVKPDRGSRWGYRPRIGWFASEIHAGRSLHVLALEIS